MSFKENFKLTTNPFRLTPATSDKELIWAGFPGIKEKFEKRIKRSIRIPNSSLVLNWGEYGSGKTHASRFFNKDSELLRISKEVEGALPYSINITLPKGKDPVYSIYTAFIDKLDIIQIRGKVEESGVDLEPIIAEMSDNMQIQSVLKAIFSNDIRDVGALKKYLYGNLTNSELKKFNDYGILRPLKSDSDYTKLLAGLFTCLTYNKSVYSSVIIWFDEFEDLAILSNSNIDKTNNFLREIIDNTPNNLLIFLNLTQSALFGIEDLSEYLSEAVKSRIKERINFDFPTRDKFKAYFRELLSFYRVGDEPNDYYPFDESLVDKLADDLGDVSLRTFNEAFSLLLELADLENLKIITTDFYEKNKNEIIGWKDL